MSKVSRILRRKRDTARAERARDVLAAKRAASKRERRQLRRAKASRSKKKGGAEAAAGLADPPRNTDAESPSVRPSPALPVHAGEPGGRPAAREGSRNTALGHCVDSAPAHPYRQPAEPHATPICGKRKQRNTPLARALRLVQAGAPGLQTSVDLVAGVRGAKEAQQARRPAPPVAKVRLLSLPLEPKVDGQVGPGQDAQPAPSSQEGGPAVTVRPDVAVLGQDRGLRVAEAAGTSAAAAAAAVSQRDRAAGRQPGQEPAESRDTSLSSELQPQPQMQMQRHEQGQQGLHESPPCESEAAVCAREAAVAAARLAAIAAAAALPPDSPYVRAVMETCSGQATGGQAGQNQLSAHGLLQPQHEQQQRRRRRGLGAVDSEYVACAKHAAAAAAHLAALEAAAALPADSPYLKAAVEVGRGAGFGWPDERGSDVWAQQRALLQQQTARLQRALGAALCEREGEARYIPAGPVPEGHGAGACSSGAAASLEFRVGSSPGHAEAASGARGAVLAAEAATAEAAEAACGILVHAVVAGGGPAGSGRGGGTGEVRAHHGSAVTAITPGCSVCSRMQASRNGVQAADAPAGTGVGGAAEAPEGAAAVLGAAGQGARVSEWVGSLLLQSPQAESALPVFQKSKPGAEASGPAAEGRDPSPQVPAAIGCGASSTTHGSGNTSSGNGATTGSSNSGDDSGGSTSSGGSLRGAADSSHSGGSGGDRVRSLSGARRSLHRITDSSRSNSSGCSDQSTSKDVNDTVTSSGGGGLGAGGCGGGAGAVAGDEPSTAVPESLHRPASERSPGRCELTAAAGGGAEAGSAEAGGRTVVPARESQSWAQQLLPEHLPQWEDEVPSDGSSCSDTDGSEFEEGDWEDDDWPGGAAEAAGAAEAKDGSRDKSQHSADKPGASDVTDHMMAAVLSQAAPEHSAGAKRAGGEAAILHGDGSDSHGGPDAFVDNELAAWEAALEAGAGPHESQAEAPQQLAAAVTVSELALLGHGTGPVQQSQRRLPASGSGPAGHDTAGLGAGAAALAEPQLQLPDQFDVNLLAPPVLVPAGTKLQALPPWSVGSPVTSPGLTQAGPGPSAAAGPRVAQVVSGSPYTDAYELPDDGGHPHLGGGAAPLPSRRKDGGGLAAGVGAHAGRNARRGMTAAVTGPGGTRVGAASPPLVLSASGSGGGLATPGQRRGRLVMLHGAGAAACGTPTSQPRAGRAAGSTATAGGAGLSAVAAAGPGMGDLGDQGQPLPAEPPGAATRPVGMAGRAPPLSPLRRSNRVPGGQQQQQQHAAGMAAQGQGHAEPSANGEAGRSRASAGGGMSPSRRAAVRLQRQPVVPSPRRVEDSRLHRSGQQQAVVGVGTAGGSRVGDRARGGSGAGLSAAAAGVIQAATASPSRGRTRSKPPGRASIAGRGRGGRGRRATARSHRQSESDQEETADAVRSSDPEEDTEKEGGGKQTRGAPARRRAPRTPSEVLNRLQVSDLRPVLHLPLVEAARQLGLHRTSFMTRCRQLGIARWPAKQLRMLDLMEEQLQELEACGVANHYTAKKCLEEAPGWLAQVAAARSALLENPCGFTMPQPLELLRQRHVKVAWAHRQKCKAALGEEGEEGEEGDDLDSQAQTSQ